LAAQLQQLFGFCGTVKDCHFVGIARTYALVEFETEEVCTGLWESNQLCPPSDAEARGQRTALYYIMQHAIPAGCICVCMAAALPVRRLPLRPHAGCVNTRRGAFPSNAFMWLR